jgi:lipocalin
MIIKTLLTSSLIVSSLAGIAQNRNVAYAITGDGNNDFIWMNIRQVDLSSGKVTKTIFERSKTNYTLTDLDTKKSTDQTAIVDGNIFGAAGYPTSTFVAAAALDNRSNKLFFTPMRMGELRWLDLNIKNDAPKFYSMQSDVLKVGNVNDEANNITRMVIAADGYGYAVTNDGNHLFRFTTAKKPVITDLGNLIDADDNKGMSVHNKCSSWGGDMLADAFGKLYLISANKNVFVVDINTRITTFKGGITGLPAQYTTNGAAVSADGDIIVTSANFFEGYYKVKLADLTATKMVGSDAKYNASDLANGNLLLEKEAAAANKFDMASSKVPVATFVKGEAKVFPNPVSNSTFNVSFTDQKEGRYTILFADVAGRTLQTQTMNVVKAGQTEQVNIHSRPAKGVYMVKVLDAQNQVVLTEKIVLE